jgi:hypothetical protein
MVPDPASGDCGAVKRAVVKSLSRNSLPIYLRERAAELWRNIEIDTPEPVRLQRSVTREQIHAVPPHQLRSYVQKLVLKLAALHKPALILRLTRPQMEVNPVAHFTDDRDKTAMGGPATQHRFVTGLLCSGVRAQHHATGTIRYACTRHTPQHGPSALVPQRVHTRPGFILTKAERNKVPVRDEIHVNDCRALSTTARIQTYADKGVPSHEYDITLPAGIRREALGSGSAFADCYLKRADLVRDRRRATSREQLCIARAASARAATQRIAKDMTKRQRALKAAVGGVRKRIEEPAQTQKNKQRWHQLCATSSGNAHARRGDSLCSLSSTPDNTQDTTGPHGMSQHTKAAGLQGKVKHKGAAQTHSTRTDD